jgi:DHA2 family multidrug resistance protein-like MFS transporter
MSSAADTSPVLPRATRREWLGLAVLALPCMLYSMDLTVLNLAIPSLAADLKPSASQMLWIIDIYGFMVAGFLLVMGSLGDRFGRRRVLMIGAAAFGLASVIAASAQTAEQLIAARALLGITGATIAPSTLSLISAMFRDEGERTFAISMWIMSFTVGAIIGPVLGGILIQWFWWGSVFLLALPVMVLLLILGPRVLPEYRNPDAPGIDVASAFLSLAAVLSLIWGVKHWAEIGANGPSVASILAGIALAVVFARRQTRITHPFIDLALFRSRTFNVALGVNGLSVFFMFGSFIFQAQYLQLVAGLSPVQAGLWSLPGALAFAAASPFTSRVSDRFGAARTMAGGLLISAIGFACMAFSDSLLAVVLSGMVLSVGITPVFALTTGFILAAAPVEKAGVASGMSETMSELGGALGIAILGSLLTAIYRMRLADAEMGLVPAEGQAAARATLAGAVEALSGIPGAETALELARGAFMDAFHATAVVAAVALAILAAAVFRVLKAAPVAAH